MLLNEIYWLKFQLIVCLLPISIDEKGVFYQTYA